ncbi:MAG: HAD family phosphatase [Pseudomonadota bacterium]
MHPSIVLFDLGNVIVDWEPQRLYRQRFGSSEKADWFCKSICTMEWHTRHDAGASFDDTIPALQEKHPEYADHIAAWCDQWLEMFHGYVPGVPRIIAELEEAKVPLYGLSNVPADLAQITFNAFPMIKVLRDVIVSGVEGVIKPNPEIYRIVLDRMGNPDPRRIFFVDDRAENIEAAEAMGMAGHVFEGAAGLRKALFDTGILTRP